MSKRKDKTPEQVSDEGYKVVPTSADRAREKKRKLQAKTTSFQGKPNSRYYINLSHIMYYL